MRLVIRYRLLDLLENGQGLSPVLSNFLARSSIFSDPDFRSTPAKIKPVGSFSKAETISHFMDTLRVLPISSKTITAKENMASIEADSLGALESLADKNAHEEWPKGVLPGDREVCYANTVQVLARLASKIEIIDPYLGEKIIKSQSQLWLINRLIEDSEAHIALITRSTEFMNDNGVDKFRMENEVDSLLSRSRHLSYKSLKIRVFSTSKHEFHNRAIRFVFDNAVSSDHSLEKGVELFASKEVLDSDLPFMSARQYNERWARFERYQLDYEVRHEEKDGERFWAS